MAKINLKKIVKESVKKSLKKAVDNGLLDTLNPDDKKMENAQEKAKTLYEKLYGKH